MASEATQSTANIVAIVDDDAQVRRFLAEALSSFNIPSEEYVSGEDFLQRWKPEGVGCILLDVRMPRVTGPEVHEWLLKQPHKIPVIFLSGFADVPTAVRAMRLGAYDFLEKPFKVQKLIDLVRRAMSGLPSPTLMNPDSGSAPPLR